jgi:hypothetical protein
MKFACLVLKIIPEIPRSMAEGSCDVSKRQRKGNCVQKAQGKER